MKKKSKDGAFPSGKALYKFWKVMRLQLLIILITLFQLRAETLCAQQKVTISFKNAQIEEVIKAVEAQSGYVVVYNNTLLKTLPRVSVEQKDADAVDALNAALRGSGLVCRLMDGFLVIAKEDEKKEDKKKTVREIKGKVVDDSGMTLPGATVLIKGTSLGVVTDVDGKFRIEIPQMDSTTLVVSFVGFLSQEIKLKADPKDDAKDLIINLHEDVKQMEEVVVTGYANISKESFTGNSVTVKREDLLKVSKTNVIQALQVFDPSFRIQDNNRWGSDPNALPEMYVRGRSGIGVKDLDRNALSKSELENNPNLPTFIMDGYEISIQKLYDFDPNRIESMTILKDAAATAMYGSRAANGVVIITTVAPVPGKVSVSYSLTGTLTMPDLSDYNLMNAKEKFATEIAAQIYQSDDRDKQYKLDQEYNGKLNNILKGVNTYWLSKPLQTVFNHKHSVYIEGGTQDIRFGLDFLYNNDDGVMKQSYRDRTGVGFYVDYRIGTLQVKNYVSYNMTRSADSPYGTFSDYTRKLPYDVYKDENGKYLEETKQWHGEDDRENPLYEAGLSSFNRDRLEEFNDNLGINWYITEWLQLKGTLSLTKTIEEGKNFLDPHSKKNSKPLSIDNHSSGELTLTDAKGLSLDMNVQLAMNRAFGMHHVNLNLALNARTSDNSSTLAEYRGFPTSTLNSPNYAEEIVTKPTVTQNKTRLIGFVGSLNYTYNNIYLMDFSLRSDGSSEFGSDRRFATFWAGGLGINLHQYDFMKSVNGLDILKIRGSYGITGKVNFPPYAAQTMYQIQDDEWYQTGFGASLIALGNKNLGWERTKTLDLGFELQLYEGLIHLEASYYRKKTVDLINSVTIPSASGFTTYMDNIGEMMNKGYEIQFRSNIINRKDLMVAVYGNLAHNKNEILKISESLKAYNDAVKDHYANSNQYDGSTAEPFTQYVEGGSVTSIFAMRSKGIDPSTGEELLIRRDGTYTYKWNASEQVVVGNTEPKAQGSFGFNVRYKNLSLYTSFLYEFGGQHYNSTLVEKVENADIYNENVDKRVLTGRWQKPGDRAKYKALQSGVEEIKTTNPTERFVQDYNTVSLNSLTLGYDFSQRLIQSWGLSMLRLEIGANDLFRISSVKEERGLSYPYARTMNISLRASF